MTYRCDRCCKVQHKDQMRPSKKIKGLTREQSRRHKMCWHCGCRTFWRVS